jgi:hypothetical protein
VKSEQKKFKSKDPPKENFRKKAVIMQNIKIYNFQGFHLAV